jgi:hypothetical protein
VPTMAFAPASSVQEYDNGVRARIFGQVEICVLRPVRTVVDQAFAGSPLRADHLDGCRPSTDASRSDHVMRIVSIHDHVLPPGCEQSVGA